MSDLKVGSLPTVTAATVGSSDIKAAATAGRPISDADNAAPRAAAATTPPSPVVQTSAALDPGEQPVDSERVTAIRTAIASGRYPLNPARIGDAMIAAGLLLQSPKP